MDYDELSHSEGPVMIRISSTVCFLTVGIFSQTTIGNTTQNRLNRLEAQLDQQSKEIRALKDQHNAFVNFKTGGPFLHQKTQPTISSTDGNWSIWPVLLTQGDWAYYSKSQPLSLPGTDNLKSTGENIRRAWIGFEGTLACDFGYRVVMDFGGANGNESAQAYAGANTLRTQNNDGKSITPFTANTGQGPYLQSAWVSYRGFLAPFTFRIGLMPVPSNLADGTKSSDLLFNERPTPGQISRDLDAGEARQALGFVGNGTVWFASLFLTGDVYGRAAIIPPATTTGGAQQALVGRLAIAPYQCLTTNLNVHVGANFGYVFRPQEFTNTQNPGFTTFNIQLSDRPELRVDNITFINTGPIDANSANATGLELAFSYHTVMLQGEYFHYGISRDNPGTPPPGIENPNFNGWYVEGSWTLLGEPRRYNIATASFTRPSPLKPFNPWCRHWGAWELVGRYSSTDLDFKQNSTVKYTFTEPGAGHNSLTISNAVIGGTQKICSAGLNFYPNDALKFMFAWQNVHLANIGAINNNGNYNTFEVRTQIALQ